MSSKNQVEITIGEHVIEVSGQESEKELKQIAEYLNKKRQEFLKKEAYKHLNNEMRQLLIQLNIAGDYLKIKKEFEEIYDLKHELVETKQELIDAKQDVSDLNHKLIAANINYENLLDELNDLKKLKRTKKK